MTASTNVFCRKQIFARTTPDNPREFSQPTLAFLLCLAVGCGDVTPALGAWSSDPMVNNALSATSGNQVAVQILSDGAGGNIFVWQDQRAAPTNADIYAQRFDANGTPLWTVDGVPLCTATGNQTVPQFVSDGSGGAIATWQDFRSGSGDIYAQRFNSSGVAQWTADGIAICTATNDQTNPYIAVDGSNGVIITWEDSRGLTQDLYCQRVNSSGAIQWAPDGVAFCTAAAGQFAPRVISDGAGGVIATWDDARGDGADIFSQRINGSGTALWTADGVALCTATNFQFNARLTGDGSSGAIFSWEDLRGVNRDIYCQRVNSAGAVQWTVDGVGLCMATGNQTTPQITGDNAGNAIVVWKDLRGGVNNDIYAQRVNSAGAPQWTADGIGICVAANNKSGPQIVGDGAGGALIAWEDQRVVFEDIYAQRVNSAGSVQWTADGVAVCTNAESQTNVQIAHDGSGGAIIAWRDLRSTTNIDLYTSRVFSNGTLPVSISQWTLE